MSSKIYVDGILVDWGASLFNQTHPPRPRPEAKSTLTGVKPRRNTKKATSGGTISTTDSAARIRKKLDAIARRVPEVMVKISGGGNGMNQIKAHFDYISRNGQIALENQDGQIVEGRGEIDHLRDDWQTSGYRIKDETTTREAFNIVLSMPEGTDPHQLHKAARDFAKSEFAGHEYVMALHTFETDPDPEPARHPHVHLSVKARSDAGVRMNPRKGDLQRWREGFAQSLRDHGVEAVATSRQVRLQRQRGTKTSVAKMRDRGEPLDQIGRSAPDLIRAKKAKFTQARIIEGYRHIATALATSDDGADRRLAMDLADRIAEASGRTVPTKDRKIDKDQPER
ncbi:hypothetical protein [Asticcacaulis sp. EMRT-3]|uniref:relaxase/mobilization nuclease domain-containing protein n=1 Tax=Asticcacaulis sp. EMRT-3 TaxID=3040349 RepID=UPI0024AE9593|nr:hypothetical protein [Asticcacaulis sp. EMRT-3]MDI7776564.1 hypothetical protein [Asticcacaulis sp. EMRT-3]